MAIYGNATNHVMWAVPKWGMMAWPIQTAISSRLRTLGILGYRSYGVNLLRGCSRKSWKNMENHGIMASFQGNDGVSLDFTLNKFEEQNIDRLWLACGLRLHFIFSDSVPELDEGKRTRDPLFTGKKHDFPLSQSNHSGCFPRAMSP